MKGQRQLHPKQAMLGVEPDYQSTLKPLFVLHHLPGMVDGTFPQSLLPSSPDHPPNRMVRTSIATSNPVWNFIQMTLFPSLIKLKEKRIVKREVKIKPKTDSGRLIKWQRISPDLEM